MAEALLDETQALESTTVGIYRTATVVKGGRRFSFGALVVVGDRNGSVGIGYGKAPGVPAAIEKAQKEARKKMCTITLEAGTLPHTITSRFGASIVRLVPAASGTGVIAGATVRAVLELAGIQDCLTKAYGSTNPKNLCRATLAGLMKLHSRREVEQLRGVDLGPSLVEKRLEAGRRYAPATKTSALPMARLQRPVGRGRPRRGGRKRTEVGSAAPAVSGPTGAQPVPQAAGPAAPATNNEPTSGQVPTTSLPPVPQAEQDKETSS